MGSTIAACQKNIADLVSQLKRSEGQDVRFSLIPYRDHRSSNGYCTKVYPFTRDVDQMLSNVNAQSASGGGDAPEAVTAALCEGLVQDWREDAAKLLVFMADAGPHGLGEGHECPDGDPDGKCPLALAREAQTLGISVYSLLVGNCSDKTRWFFAALSHMTGGQAMKLASASALGDAILDGARENIDLERSIVHLRSRVAALEREKRRKLTDAEREAVENGNTVAATAVRKIPADSLLTVPFGRIEQAMAAPNILELRKLFSQSNCAASSTKEAADDSDSRVARAAAARDGRSTDKVVVECILEAGKVRARVISAGYDATKNCQFPRGIRQAGKKFLVDAVIDAGTFYRIRGNVQSAP
jgi:hypothetical protein